MDSFLIDPVLFDLKVFRQHQFPEDLDVLGNLFVELLLVDRPYQLIFEVLHDTVLDALRVV
jgi:hypothetical protein